MSKDIPESEPNVEELKARVAELEAKNQELEQTVKTQQVELAAKSDIITSRDEQIAHLQEQLKHDQLTGLKTAHYYKQQVARTVRILEGQEPTRKSEKLTTASLLFIDIDNFKSFNSEHGELAGDEVLKVVAGAIKGHVRESDIVSRIENEGNEDILLNPETARRGGEEIVVLLPNTNIEGAEKVGLKICDLVHNLEIEYKGQKLQVTISIGVAEYEPGISATEFEHRADRAMKQAKDEGKDRVHVYHSGDKI